MDKVKISAYIIAYNQRHKIASAISSVLWCDEIIVCDSYSDDGTTQYAQQLGARVIQVPFAGFGHLRNQAIAACQYPWILSIDSDECCTEALQMEIQSIIHSSTSCDIYYIPRKNYFMGRWIRYSGWYPDYRQPQLFRNGYLRYKNDPVHEGYELSTSQPVGYLKNAMLQMPFGNLSEMMKKADRYSTLGVHRLKEKYKKSSMFLAVTHALWTFIQHYIVKRGCLDGWPGLVIAMGQSYGTFYRYAKFYELEKNWANPFEEVATHSRSVIPSAGEGSPDSSEIPRRCSE